MTFKQIKSVENVIIRLAHQLSHAGSDSTVRFPFIIRVLQPNKVDSILDILKGSVRLFKGTLLKTTVAGAGVDLVGGPPKMSSNVAVDLQCHH